MSGGKLTCHIVGAVEKLDSSSKKVGISGVKVELIKNNPEGGAAFFSPTRSIWFAADDPIAQVLTDSNGKYKLKYEYNEDDIDSLYVRALNDKDVRAVE